MSRKNVRVTLKTATATLLTIPFLLPFFFLITVALKTTEDYRASPIGIPSSLTFEHIRGAWERAELGSALWNSLFTSAVGVVVACLLSVSAAFWFIIHRSRRANGLRWAMVLGYAFPAVIWLTPRFVLLARNGSRTI